MTSLKQMVIIEDEVLHINLFKRSIRRSKKLNFELITATNGKEGIQAIDKHFSEDNADKLYVLLDINMPIMTGFEVMEYINTKPYRSEINLIILTTSDDIEDLELAKQLGYDEYLVKPVSHQMLESILGDD